MPRLQGAGARAEARLHRRIWRIVPPMRLSSPIVLASLLLVAACKGDDGDSTTMPGSTSTTSPETTDDTPTSTTPDPSTSSPSSTGGTTTDDTTAPSSTTTGGAIPSCISHLDANTCAADDRCKWDAVFTYTHGTNGCQGDVVMRCVDDMAGAPSTWYYGNDPDYQVVGFEYTPTDVPDDYKLCDCEGPLACLCAFNAPDCPDRLGDFCGTTTSELACEGAVINGEFACGWFTTSPEGPLDDTCTTQSIKKQCLPATNAGSNDCTEVDYSMLSDKCSVTIPPAYWRELNGVIEITSACGPVPPSPEWTLCDAVDTPEQPGECGCACEFVF
jgi:hypothetical protein